MVSCSFVAIIMVRFDKNRAKMRKQRISERTLFLMAWIGGSPGILGGMQLFRHKTKKPSFKYGVPLIIIIQVGLIFSMSWVI
nr:DUF1294 domain-containing protein [Salsuginibacillus halophilus]